MKESSFRDNLLWLVVALIILLVHNFLISDRSKKANCPAACATEQTKR